MNLLLIFFAIPIATIILSVILQTLICCPFKVAGIAFSIFIVVAFALGGTAALIVAAIIYTIISFVSAVITMFIQNRIRDNDERDNNCNNDCNNNWNNSCDNNWNNSYNNNWNNIYSNNINNGNNRSGTCRRFNN